MRPRCRSRAFVIERLSSPPGWEVRCTECEWREQRPYKRSATGRGFAHIGYPEPAAPREPAR